MNWFAWSLLSALFAGVTAILAKVGVEGMNSSLATAIRTCVGLVFAWGLAIPALPLFAATPVRGSTLCDTRNGAGRSPREGW